jgi:hypothetical protein
MLPAIAIRNTYVFVGVLVALACIRVCFAGVLWSDEDYHMAAAIHILHGKIPYRDFWYDKPPLSALYYLMIGAVPGLVLRLWDGAYVLLCCFLAHKLARNWWGEAEGRVAALLVAFFTTFYLPAAVIPFAPDALLIAPHLGAIHLARQGKGWAAGLICALGFWINVKALFVLAACAIWAISSAIAFSAAIGLGTLVLAALGALPGYWEQVWIWGFSYAKGAPLDHPIMLSLARLGNWFGFHAALVISWFIGAQQELVRLALWLAFSFAAVCFGNHFAPRYFLQLLPPLAVVGARGICVAFAERKRFASVALVLLLVVPFVRFAPRYLLMLRGAPWSDIALNLDSQRAAAQINRLARPGDTLFVWGYRPDVFVYTRLNLASKFWDSQPLTGVAADRHLNARAPVATDQTIAHLKAVEESRPTFFVDGLGLLNDKLTPQRFPEMRALLHGYREVARTRLSIIYQKGD